MASSSSRVMSDGAEHTPGGDVLTTWAAAASFCLPTSRTGRHTMGRLEGKVALISGGARGQGAAETRLFVREGAAVVFGDVLDDDGKKVEAQIRASGGGRATYVHLNVTREADWRGGGGAGRARGAGGPRGGATPRSHLPVQHARTSS